MDKQRVMLHDVVNVLELQNKAAEVKQWLRDNPYADIEAIRQQRERLKTILEQIKNTVK